jgi:hypothetical protein
LAEDDEEEEEEEVVARLPLPNRSESRNAVRERGRRVVEAKA